MIVLEKKAMRGDCGELNSVPSKLKYNWDIRM